MRKITYITLLTVLILTATACSAAPQLVAIEERSMEAPVSEPAREPQFGVEESGMAGDDAFSGSSAAAVERLVIRTANLTIVVSDPAASIDDISGMAESMGGYVVSSNLFQTTFSEAGVTADRGSITIRVPSERLGEALDEIKEEATDVRNEQVSGEDVTDQYTDLQSRLRNLQAAEEQLLEILNEATETDNVLEVFRELTRVREEIEVIQGRMQYLSESARLSSISVELIPDVADQPISIGGWKPVGTAKDAVEALLRTLRFLGDAAIWTAICVLPVGLLLGLPAYFVVRTIVRRRRKSQAERGA